MIGFDDEMTVPSASFSVGSFRVPGRGLELVARALAQERDRAAVRRDDLVVLDARAAQRLLHAAARMDLRAAVVAVADVEGRLLRRGRGHGPDLIHLLSALVAAENTVGIAILSAVILAGGYAVVVGLWYLMVYRPSRDERRAAESRAASRPTPLTRRPERSTDDAKRAASTRRAHGWGVIRRG